MSDSARHPELESLLAHLLDKGTWLASAVIGVGLLLAGADRAVSVGPPNWGGSSGMFLVRVGVALFIALPIVRLLVMMVVFWRERDYRFGTIALLVLLIIGVGAGCATWLKRVVT